MNAIQFHARRTWLLAAIGVALALPVHAQQAFPSPDEGVAALVRAFGSQQTDPARIAVVLGPDWRKACYAYRYKSEAIHATCTQFVLALLRSSSWPFVAPRATVATLWLTP